MNNDQNKDKIDILMNDIDPEYIAPKKIELTDNPENVSVLRQEACCWQRDYTH